MLLHDGSLRTEESGVSLPDHSHLVVVQARGQAEHQEGQNDNKDGEPGKRYELLAQVSR